VEVTCPTTIAFYNKFMGGTDRFNQLGSYYNDRRKTTRWTMRIFVHLFRAAIINAAILFNRAQREENQRIPLVDFTKVIIAEWSRSGDVTEHATNSRGIVEADVHGRASRLAPEAAGSQPRRTVKYWNANKEKRTTGKHSPTKVEAGSKRVRKGTTVDHRGNCRVCSVKAGFKCRECDVYLCLAREGEYSCWDHFHDGKDLQRV